jgi:hypothetical protein
VPLFRLATTARDAPASQPAGQPAAGGPPPPRASFGAIGFAYVAVGIGVLAGWGLYELLPTPTFRPNPGTSVFALLFVFAAAIERVIEPLSFIADSGSVPEEGGVAAAEGTKADAVGSRNAALAAARQATTLAEQTAKLEEAVRWERLIEQIRRNKAVVIWGVACALGSLISGALGVFLLRTLGYEAHALVDVMISGLAIGSGTKPLHELIKSLQTSKEEKKTPPEGTGGP